MQLLDLPNEVLLNVFKYGGTDMLIGGPAHTCKLLREISEDPQLWEKSLEPYFSMQLLSREQIDRIPDLREWLLKQRNATKRVAEGLDLLINEMRDATPEDLEIYSWQILKMRLKATEGLDYACTYPKSLGHYHWAHWLKEVTFRLEGLHMLLQQSTTDNWGNGIVENPINQIMALYTLRTGNFPQCLFDAINNKDRIANSVIKDSSPENVVQNSQELAKYVIKVFDQVSKRNDFLTVLGRGCIFMELCSTIGCTARLLKLPFGSYVCVNPIQRSGHQDIAPFFIDFLRQGKVRSVDEVRERLHVIGVSNNLQYGVSLYDTLSTAYVWHTVPTSTRHCVLDLIEHAANEVKVSHLTAAPRLYNNLVRRIIKRNISEVEDAPLSRAVSSASLVSMVGTSPGGWLRRGKVVRILAGDSSNENEFSDRESSSVNNGNEDLQSSSGRFGVVLDVSNGSVLVQTNLGTVRVIKAMLQASPRLALKTVAGLQVPDIDVDIISLGQHFMNYNVVKDQFE